MTAGKSMRLPWLDPGNPDAPFPSPDTALADPNGLLAIGGDLSAGRLLRAYSQGIFPWYNPNEPILWWSPDPRCVFFVDRVHIARSLRRALDRDDYAITLDRNFTAVIEACAGKRKTQRGTWLSPPMIHAYKKLHAEGHAHSIEVWRNHQLIGGLYGLSLGRMFFGESMFSDATDASKIALVHLARQLAAWGFELIDGQVGSDHLYRMGAVDVPRQVFMSKLHAALEPPGRTGPWEMEVSAPAEPVHLP